MPVLDVAEARSKSRTFHKEWRDLLEIERGPADNKSHLHYTGKQTGDKIKGTIETTVDGEERKSDWDA